MPCLLHLLGASKFSGDPPTRHMCPSRLSEKLKVFSYASFIYDTSQEAKAIAFLSPFIKGSAFSSSFRNVFCI